MHPASLPTADTAATSWGWTALGMVGSGASGLVGWLSAMPPGLYLSVLGVLGSIVVPIVKFRTDSRLASLAIDAAALRAERARDAVVITDLRAERDRQAAAADDLRMILMTVTTVMRADRPDPAEAPADA